MAVLMMYESVGEAEVEVEVAVLSSSSTAAQEDGLAASRVWGHNNMSYYSNVGK